ncbi:lipopolysaccharide biosynthesis protein [Paraflavitalea pollutisoli]|uniref:lipopolysaccharide biosynthesis protein n=1 Tax=Paraflavitalea pollutisoli TaxID=3034143 RepID=UPI0023EBA514|nr:lipopolysaccharide biosynthesis protein [Paraflavitalea sp. H1-2-19X]
MGQIRKQVIQSSFISYIGFIIGAINTWFFVKQGLFTPEQYGLTQVMISISQVLTPLASLGMTVFIYRFFPYYTGRLASRDNDMLSITVVFTCIGALVVFCLCLFFEPLIIRQFAVKSKLLVEYYYWTLLYSFFFLCFTTLEAYLWSLKRTVLSSFMKETAYRILVLVLIGLYAFGVIDFRSFVILFSCTYFLIVLVLVAYLAATHQLYFARKISPVTKKFRKSIFRYVGSVYAGSAITSMARQIDTLSLAGARDLSDTGIYSLNQFIAAILQVPYRGLQAIAVPMISEHWKNKNYPEINRIYQRSSINLLLIGSFLFANIWLNYTDAFAFFNVEPKFLSGKTVFLLLGLYNVFELATGTNTAIIATSPAWRFEFYSGLILMSISIPLNILLANLYGMNGVAFATMSTLVIYNIIRLIFIRHRFKMWPFSMKSLYALLLVIAALVIAYYPTNNLHGLVGMLLRSVLFSGCFFAGVFYFKLTPDLPQFIEVVKNRLRKKR